MKFIPCFLGLLLVTATVSAQVDYNIIKRQAKDAGAASGNASQGITPQAPPAAPADPVLAATLQNISSLTADISALCKAPAGTVDPALKLALLNDLSTAAQGVKPAKDAIENLATDFSAAVAGRKIPEAVQAKLAQTLHGLMNSSHLNVAQLHLMPGIVQKALTHVGVAEDEAKNVVADLKAVADQTK